MNDSSSIQQSTIATISDDIYNLFSDLFTGYKTVKTFTDQEIQEQQIAVTIDSMENLHHGNYSDYQINITISGQTYIENDPDKQQINALTGVIGNSLKNLSIDDINMYIINAVGYLFDDCNFEDDGYTHNVRFHLKMFINDL